MYKRSYMDDYFAEQGRKTVSYMPGKAHAPKAPVVPRLDSFIQQHGLFMGRVKYRQAQEASLKAPKTQPSIDKKSLDKAIRRRRTLNTFSEIATGSAPKKFDIGYTGAYRWMRGQLLQEAARRSPKHIAAAAMAHPSPAVKYLGTLTEAAFNQATPTAVGLNHALGRAYTKAKNSNHNILAKIIGKIGETHTNMLFTRGIKPR